MSTAAPFDYKYTRKVMTPGGESGSRTTLKMMRQLSTEGKKDPNIRAVALRVTQPYLQKDYRGEAYACFTFVQNCIRYVRDIDGVEVLQTPAKTLEICAGDCDDKSTLLASMLLSIGHPCRFLAIGNVSGHYYHVIVESKLGKNWISLDTTENRPFGWRPKYRSYMVMHV